jgi:hypothetical protein
LDKDGILLVDYLKESTIIPAKHYIALLDKLKQRLVSKLSKGILFLQDNAGPDKADITHQKLADPKF